MFSVGLNTVLMTKNHLHNSGFLHVEPMSNIISHILMQAYKEIYVLLTVCDSPFYDTLP